jgi:hypothetical protein
MPKAWTKKDERQYEHIKEDARRRGKGVRRAKEIAARTVNKHRRLSGRTANKTTQGTGNPNLPLEERTVAELRNLAREVGIKGAWSLKKGQLVEALRSRR